MKNIKSLKTEPKRQTDKPKLSGKKVAVIAVSAALVLAVVTASIIGIVFAVRQGSTFDYLKDDLSRYVYLSRDDYSSYEAENRVIPVNELLIENEKLKLLAQNRSKDPENNGTYVRDKAIGAGDVVCIYYRGYTVDGDGRETNIVGENNYVDDKFLEVTVGSGDMPLGFELGLLGITPKEYPFFTKISSGTVAEGDVAYLDYKLLSADGITTSYAGKRIVLGDAADSEMGEGFTDFIVGRNVGERISASFSTVLKGDIQESVYYDVNVKFVTRCESDPIVVEAYMPNDYEDVAYRAKKVYYDVFVEKLIDYTAPEYNDTFVTDTLKISADELSLYEGSTALEKHEKLIEARLKEEHKEATIACIEEQMWEHYKEKTTVKTLPESEVKRFYDVYYTEVTAEYVNYKDSYQTLDAFARAYLDLGTNDNWREYLREFARTVVTQKLIFYYVIREEGLVPTASEYDALYSEIFDECLDAYLSDIDFDRADYKTEEEYLKALEENKKIVLDYYGESYLKESVYYKFAIDELTGFASLK
jgi:FKBP-type peptidyl-prolyl cis-trans isomerase (trigger factor)